MHYYLRAYVLKADMICDSHTEHVSAARVFVEG